MAEKYLHIEVDQYQASKRDLRVCGDVVEFKRSSDAVTIFLCDGMGSGIKANLSAQMCTSRFFTLLERGFSFREAFNHILQTMEEAKHKELPYAVFSAIRVLNDGIASVLTYEMPPPLLCSRFTCDIMKQHITTLETAIVGESNAYLRPGDGILIMSDGVVYAGTGAKLRAGWKSEGVNQYAAQLLSRGTKAKELPKSIVKEAKMLWDNIARDDITVVSASCRKGRILNLLTGPPSDNSKDEEIVSAFMQKEGLKIVCGATTSKIVARYLGKSVYLNDETDSDITPPDYSIDGIDLATEGAITLNQVYNIYGEKRENLKKANPATELYLLLEVVDRVNFFIGNAINPAVNDISFTQQGILRRDKIIPLLADKLREAGKFVEMYQF
ncbi:MAG: SpoIIE family protein phosphatase [Ignavibacteria bacterium]|nr:SpoIIE family protein phosphatase [Ignavibacteria bacterium]